MKKLKKDKHNLIGILGIFIGIFTLISIEVKILGSTTDFFRLSGLSIITFSLINLFILSLFIIGENWINNKNNFTLNFSKLIKLNTFNFIFLLIGILLVGFGDFRNPSEVKNNSDFLKLEDEVKENKLLISDLNSEIKNLQTTQDKLKSHH